MGGFVSEGAGLAGVFCSLLFWAVFHLICFNNSMISLSSYLGLKIERNRSASIKMPNATRITISIFKVNSHNKKSPNDALRKSFIKVSYFILVPAGEQKAPSQRHLAMPISLSR